LGEDKKTQKQCITGIVRESHPANAKIEKGNLKQVKSK